MKQPKPGTPPPEAEAGRRVIRAFMDLGVNDMRYCLDAMERVYKDAKTFHDEMMDRELRRLGELERKAAGFKKSRAKPQPKYRSRRDKKLTWSGRGSLPTWLREEMKSSRAKLDAFLIAKRK